MSRIDVDRGLDKVGEEQDFALSSPHTRYRTSPHVRSCCGGGGTRCSFRLFVTTIARTIVPMARGLTNSDMLISRTSRTHTHTRPLFTLTQKILSN
eukprot:UN26930